MAKFTNISAGPRGAYNEGVLVMAEPGETIEADDAPKEWFAKAGRGADVGEADPDKPLAKMNKTELLAAAAAPGEGIAAIETIKVDDKDVPVAEASNKQLIEAIEAARAKA